MAKSGPAAGGILHWSGAPCQLLRSVVLSELASGAHRHESPRPASRRPSSAKYPGHRNRRCRCALRSDDTEASSTRLGASVDHTEAGCASRNRSRCLIYDPTLSTDRIHRKDSGWLGSRLKPNDRPAARVCGNPTLYGDGPAFKQPFSAGFRTRPFSSAVCRG